MSASCPKGPGRHVHQAAMIALPHNLVEVAVSISCSDLFVNVHWQRQQTGLDGFVVYLMIWFTKMVFFAS